MTNISKNYVVFFFFLLAGRVCILGVALHVEVSEYDMPIMLLQSFLFVCFLFL